MWIVSRKAKKMRLIDADRLKEHIISIAEQRGKKATTLCKLVDMQPEVSERDQVIDEVASKIKTDGWDYLDCNAAGCDIYSGGDCSYCKGTFGDMIDKMVVQLKNE